MQGASERDEAVACRKGFEGRWCISNHQASSSSGEAGVVKQAARQAGKLQVEQEAD